MREIKFREYDVHLKRFIYSFYDLEDRFHIRTSYLSYDGSREYAQQYTGMKDSKGKEIYEGDIIKVGKDLIEEVKWVDENNWMGDKCPVNGWINHQSIYKTPIKIIGNIRQNPELLR